MTYKVSEIIEFMEEWAKPVYQESWDNSGEQILFEESTDIVTIALDLTDEVIDRAIENNSKLIITHHPMFFSGIKSIKENTYEGKNIIKAIKNNISIYSAHTSLDIAENGVNDVLANVLELKDCYGLAQADSGYLIGKVGYLEEEKTLFDLKELLEKRLSYSNIKFFGKNKEKVKKIAICGGSGASFIDDAIREDVDVYITGDVKHHDTQYCYEKGFTIIDANHYQSEKLVINMIDFVLRNKFDILTELITENIYELNIEK